MTTTKLSSKGQIIIPKWLRDLHNWSAGVEFVIVDTEDGILLKPKRPFAPTRLEDVIGILNYQGPAKTIEEMDEAIKIGVKKDWNDRG